MVWIDREPEPGLGVLGQAAEQGVGRLDHLPALLADEVPMRGTGQMVRRRAMSQVRVNDNTQSLQLVEVSIDGGQVDVGSLFLHLCGQIFCRMVTLGPEQGPQQQAA